jgi:hypothetical protein
MSGFLGCAGFGLYVVSLSGGVQAQSECLSTGLQNIPSPPSPIRILQSCMYLLCTYIWAYAVVNMDF